MSLTSCPCGLTQEIVLEVAEKHGVPLDGGKCQNPLADGTEGVCGRALGAHPTTGKFHPAIHIPTYFLAVNNPPLISFLFFYCCFHLILATATGPAGGSIFTVCSKYCRYHVVILPFPCPS